MKQALEDRLEQSSGHQACGRKRRDAKRLTWWRWLADAVCHLSSSTSVTSREQVEDGLSYHLEKKKKIGMYVKEFVGLFSVQDLFVSSGISHLLKACLKQVLKVQLFLIHSNLTPCARIGSFTCRIAIRCHVLYLSVQILMFLLKHAGALNRCPWQFDQSQQFITPRSVNFCN